METVADPYRLDVSLGQDCHFRASGPEDWVNEQFARFLEAAQVRAGGQPAANGRHGSGPAAANGHNGHNEEGIWDRVFRRNEDQLSLNVLPQSKTQAADTILLLLYGYQTLLKQDSVQSMQLMEAAKQSGLRIDRIDRNLPPSHNVLVNKGGNRKGSRYALNNRGIAWAQNTLEEMFE